MTYRTLSQLSGSRLVVAAIGTSLLVAGLSLAPASAQQPPAPAAPAKKPPAKPPARPAAAAPAPAVPGAPPAQVAAPAPPAEMPQPTYSPWAKFCGKGNDASAKEVCFTGKDARTEAGQPVVAAALIEPEGAAEEALPGDAAEPLQLAVRHPHRLSTRNRRSAGAFFTCFANGCMADYEATPELVGKLKKGQMLVIQAINLAATAISFPLPLTDNTGTASPRPMKARRPIPRCSKNSRRSCRRNCRSAPRTPARSSKGSLRNNRCERAPTAAQAAANAESDQEQRESIALFFLFDLWRITAPHR